MARQEGINIPISYGGLMRYNEEYPSLLRLSPAQIVLFIILIIIFVTALKIFWPIG